MSLCSLFTTYSEQLAYVKPTAVRLLHSESYVAHPLWEEMRAHRNRFVCGRLVGLLIGQAEGYLRMQQQRSHKLSNTKRKSKAKTKARAQLRARETGVIRGNPIWVALRSCFEAESALACADLHSGICARDLHLVDELAAGRIPVAAGESLLRERVSALRQGSIAYCECECVCMCVMNARVCICMSVFLTKKKKKRRLSPAKIISSCGYAHV
jgi:hypothetical protein